MPVSAATRRRRATNREKSVALLREAGIPFISKNHGAHLLVAGRWNFWPGTGLWRCDGRTGRGVHPLLTAIKELS